jgi:hypothetical protein
VPSNRPAATTNIAIAPSATVQGRTMIRWSLFMLAPLELGFRPAPFLILDFSKIKSPL